MGREYSTRWDDGPRPEALGTALIAIGSTDTARLTRALLRQGIADYERRVFERCWGEAFETRARTVLSAGSRIPYYGERKAPGRG